MTTDLSSNMTDLPRLLRHEARVHGLPDRTVRDLGDGILLIDPADRDPSVNRLSGPIWPVDGPAFDRRLDEIITLFATHDRRPHIWAAGGRSSSDPTVTRLVGAGFEPIGSVVYLRLTDQGRITARAIAELDADVVVEEVGVGSTGVRTEPARAAALVIGEAFDLDPRYRELIERDTLRALGLQGTTYVIVRVDGEPAAVAKRVVLGGIALLSSIGARRAYRGRGLGRLATAIAAHGAAAAGAGVVYLSVEEDNHPARRMYELLGFEALPDVATQLLLGR